MYIVQNSRQLTLSYNIEKYTYLSKCRERIIILHMATQYEKYSRFSLNHDMDKPRLYLKVHLKSIALLYCITGSLLLTASHGFKWRYQLLKFRC